MSPGKGYSFQTGHRNSFGVVDIVVFCIVLSFSAFIGIFFAVKDRKNNNVKDFLLAGGNMHSIPVAMSLLATFMSAITLLGTPAEMYNFTTVYLWIGLGYVISIGLSAHLYLPVFYNLKLTSAYEYLEKRFSRGVRTLGMCVFTLQMIIYMAIVLYGPALALNAVTGLSLWGAVVAMGIVCTFYTSLGGMKAVLWTDVFQVVMMISGISVALIFGSIQTGGFRKAWQIAADSGRVTFNDFRPNPTIRHTFWSLVIGGGLLWASVYGTNQAQVQRALTCGSLKKAQVAMWMNVPGLWIILMLCSAIGIVMYAFYSTCDPLKFGLISASDQLFPLFVMDILGGIPGLPGLFVAGIFSGALSTMSSGLNSLAAVVLHDLLRAFCLQDMTESRAKMWSRALAVIFGLICLGLTWIASKLGGILQAALSLFGMLGSPMLGLFTLGILFPWANTWGAYAGVISSLLIMFWVGIGAHVTQIPSDFSLVSTEGCNWTLQVGHNERAYNDTMTTVITATMNLSTDNEWYWTESVYRLSYLWYSVLALIIVVFVGLFVSFATGFQDPKELDPRLTMPFFPCQSWFLSIAQCRAPHRHVNTEFEESEDISTSGVSGSDFKPIFTTDVYKKDDILFEEEIIKLQPIDS